MNLWRPVQHDATDQSVILRVLSTDGMPSTSASSTSAGIDLWYRRDGLASVDITEATQTSSGAHSDGGFVHLNDGYYRLDPPDAAFASGVDGVMIAGAITSMVVIGVYVPLVPYNPYMDPMPTNFEYLTVSTAGYSDARVVQWSTIGTAASTSQLAVSTQGFPSNFANTVISTAGVANANVTLWAGAAATSGNVALSTQAFPSNFANVAITTGGIVDASVRTWSTAAAAVSTSMLAISTQGFPTNFANAAITTGGVVSADAVAISGDSVAADRLEALMDGIIVGQVNSTSGTTTSFTADGFTEATNDHYLGRLITFVSGTLAGQQTDITDYVGATQTFTVSALTEAPANDDFFVIH